MVNVVHKDIFLSWCLAYLRLTTARSETATRALAVLASVDLVLLESTISSLLAPAASSQAAEAFHASVAVATELLD